MKLALFLLLVILLLGGLFGSLAGHDPGYVLLAYDKYSVETSLWFALGLLVLAYVLIRLIMFTLTRTLQSRGRLGRWFSRRSSRTAEERTAQGMLMFAEGEWSEAKRLLSAAGDKGPVPLINHLHAARAAHELGDIAERDRLLEAAGSSRNGADFAVQLSRAEMQHDAADWEPALASLLQLKSTSPRHPKVQRLLATTYSSLEDWSGLATLIPGLRKTKSLPAAEIDDLHLQVLIAELNALTDAADQADVREAVWKSVPKKLRDNTALVTAHTEAALRQSNPEAAEVIVRKAVDRGGDDALIALYGMIATDRNDKQRSVVKAWQDARSGNAAAALTMGRLYMRDQDWAMARESFEASLKLAPTATVYTELGRLCCALGEMDRGAEYLRIGMPGLPELPLPKSSTIAGAEDEETPSLADVVEEAGRETGRKADATG